MSLATACQNRLNLTSFTILKDLMKFLKKNQRTMIYLKEKKATALEREGLSAPDQSGQISIADLEKPIKEEQQWIDLIIQNPKNTIAYKALGMLYWKQHNYADAKASLEMTVKLGSKDKKVKEILDELKKIEIEDKPA